MRTTIAAVIAMLVGGLGGLVGVATVAPAATGHVAPVAKAEPAHQRQKPVKLTRSVNRISQGMWKWRVVGKATRGGKALAGQTIWLDVKVGSGWESSESMRTNRHGRFGWRFKENTYTFRFWTEPGAHSLSFKTPHRGPRTGRVPTPPFYQRLRHLG